LKKRLFILIVALVFSIGVFTVSAQQQIASLITITQPGLEIKRSATEDWVVVTMESIIGVGDRIRTNATGKAQVTLFNGNALIQLKPNTELSVNKMERTEQGFFIAFGLVNGALHQELLPVPNVYIGYEFTTPTTTIVTAGGSFDIWLDDSQNTNVLTTDGVVYVGTERVQLSASQGLRAESDGVVSEIIQADSVQQLGAGIDGIAARLITDGDIQLNIRQGPSARAELLGTVFPVEIDRVKGISQDGVWYRVRYGRGHGWVSKSGMRVEVDSQHLAVYPMDYIESLVVTEVVAATPTPTTQTATASTAVLQNFSLVELELIARINEWRVGDGLWPLKPNTTLRDMAYSQGRYLLTLASLPDDLHLDSKGRNPRQRALDPVFNWPHYLGNDRVAVGENIYIGNNMNGAIKYWQGSQIHHDTTVSLNFREIGVAILPHPLGSIYVVVFGSRPNVLPVLLDPKTNTLYFSAESYRYAAPGDWVTDVKRLQFIPSVLSPVDDNGWKPVSRQSTSPQSNPFVIAYQGDENKLLMTNFNPQEDIAWLPSNLPTGEETPTPQAAAQLDVPNLSRATPQPQPTTQSGNNLIFVTKTPTP